MNSPTLIKKYTNRRLYDTGESRYVTLDELADKIRQGTDVRVVDTKSGEDLTQATLAQILLEEPRAARMIPTPVLTQLIRMADDALAEFFEHYLTFALAMYLESHPSSDAMTFYNWYASNPLASKSLTRRWMTAPFGSSRAAQKQPSQRSSPATRESPEHGTASAGETGDADAPSLHRLAAEVDELRREVNALRELFLGVGAPRRPADTGNNEPT